MLTRLVVFTKSFVSILSLLLSICNDIWLVFKCFVDSAKFHVERWLKQLKQTWQNYRIRMVVTSTEEEKQFSMSTTSDIDLKIFMFASLRIDIFVLWASFNFKWSVANKHMRHFIKQLHLLWWLNSLSLQVSISVLCLIHVFASWLSVKARRN